MFNGGIFLQKYGIHFRYRKLNTMDYGHPERAFFFKNCQLLVLGIHFCFISRNQNQDFWQGFICPVFFLFQFRAATTPFRSFTVVVKYYWSIVYIVYTALLRVKSHSGALVHSAWRLFSFLLCVPTVMTSRVARALFLPQTLEFWHQPITMSN